MADKKTTRSDVSSAGKYPPTGKGWSHTLPAWILRTRYISPPRWDSFERVKAHVPPVFPAPPVLHRSHIRQFPHRLAAPPLCSSPPHKPAGTEQRQAGTDISTVSVEILDPVVFVGGRADAGVYFTRNVDARVQHLQLYRPVSPATVPTVNEKGSPRWPSPARSGAGLITELSKHGQTPYKEYILRYCRGLQLPRM